MNSQQLSQYTQELFKLNIIKFPAWSGGWEPEVPFLSQGLLIIDIRLEKDSYLCVFVLRV